MACSNLDENHLLVNLENQFTMYVISEVNSHTHFQQKSCRYIYLENANKTVGEVIQ